MELKSTDFNHGGRSGFTLVEIMIALTVGTLLLIAFVGATISLSRHMLAVSNYNDLDNASRNTLDLMSRDIRNASQLIACTPDATGTNYTSITFTNPSVFGNSGFSYTYAGNALTRTYCYTNGTASSRILLTNCDYLAFTLYQRVPTNTAAGFSFVEAGSETNETKLVSVSWRCSRSILGSKMNTESVQTAEIATRN
ncbi:MAG TPA: prepilin-type N-terminal cleavage/methylation domain-containing protein [Verrucomicrobiae bacterium]|nr:prepilin-type N-terminal cleavage/methylation domain-containing protein [Verrucomicrobiae bacterium]